MALPTILRPRVAALLLAGAATLLAACGDDTDSTADAPAAGGDGSTVTIERSRFAPTDLEVAAGTTVVFDNVDPYAHTVTSADDSALEFDSGPFGEDETFEQRFDEAGEYAYFCQIHPTMRATISVG